MVHRWYRKESMRDTHTCLHAHIHRTTLCRPLGLTDHIWLRRSEIVVQSGSIYLQSGQISSERVTHVFMCKSHLTPSPCGFYYGSNISACVCLCVKFHDRAGQLRRLVLVLMRVKRRSVEWSWKQQSKTDFHCISLFVVQVSEKKKR